MRHVPVPSHPGAFHWDWILPIAGLRLGVLPFLGHLVRNPLPHAWLGSIGFALITGLIALALRPGPDRRQRLLLTVCCTLVSAAAFFRYRQEQGLFLEPHTSPRYFFVPQVLLLWLLATAWSAGKSWRIAARVLGMSFVLTNLPYFRLEPFINFHWRDYAALIRDGRECVFPVNPPTMTITCPARKN